MKNVWINRALMVLAAPFLGLWLAALVSLTLRGDWWPAAVFVGLSAWVGAVAYCFQRGMRG